MQCGLLLLDFHIMADFIVINAAVKLAKVRRDSIGDRDYLVARGTLIVPGVLNGSGGRVLYEKDELEANPDDWNGMPIVIDHPSDANGNFVSARSPRVLNKVRVGEVYESQYQGKLVAELWFDVNAVRAYDRSHKTDLYKRLVNGKVTELSTGLFLDKLKAQKGATHNNKAYDYIARNIKPDHLAILLKDVGACSVADGCGVHVNRITNEQWEAITNRSEATMPATKWTHVLGNAMSYEQKSEVVRVAFRKTHPYKQNASGMTDYESTPYLSQTYEDHVIYREGEGLFRQYFTMRGSKVEFDDESTPVEMKVDYVPISNKRGTIMPLSTKERKGMVAKIQANCSCFKSKADGEMLAKMSDKALSRILANMEQNAELTTVVNAVSEGFEDPDTGTRFRYNVQDTEWEKAPAANAESDEDADEEPDVNAEEEGDPDPEEEETPTEEEEEEEKPSKPAGNKSKTPTGFQPLSKIKGKAPTKNAKKPAPTPAPAKKPTPKPQPSRRPAPAANGEWDMSNAPPAIQQIVANHKAELYDQILANVAEEERDEYTEFLNTKSFDELQKLAKLAGNRESDQPQTYIPPAGSHVGLNNNHQQPLGKPNYEWQRVN